MNGFPFIRFWDCRYTYGILWTLPIRTDSYTEREREKKEEREKTAAKIII